MLCFMLRALKNKNRIIVSYQSVNQEITNISKLHVKYIITTRIGILYIDNNNTRNMNKFH